MDDKYYELLWADKNETDLVLICLSCGNILAGPSPTISRDKYDEVTDKHNEEECFDVNIERIKER